MNDTFLWTMQRNMERLHQLDNSVENSRTTVEVFMFNTLDLYLALRRNPALADTPEWKQYRQQSAELIPLHCYPFYDFVKDTDEFLQQTFYSNEWDIACKRRSGIEAVKELYGDTICTSYPEALDTEELDDTLRWKGDMEGSASEGAIPQGIPPSHWWWWYPGDPPTVPA